MSHSDMTGFWVLGWLVIGGGLGAAIGSAKGRGGAGFLLGLLLGFIGWIIIAVMDPTPEKVAENQMRYAGAGSAGGVGAGQRRPDQQWGPDPYGRHGHRLFDGWTWTASVSDAGRQSIDEPGYPVPAADDEGWAPDPFGRYPQRFYRAGQWTNHVSRGDTTYSDAATYPSPSEMPPPPPPRRDS